MNRPHGQCRRVGRAFHRSCHGGRDSTANGTTLTDNASATYLFSERRGTLGIAGTLYNVQVPGDGVILLDAGVVVFDTETGELVREAGPRTATFAAKSAGSARTSRRGIEQLTR